MLNANTTSTKSGEQESIDMSGRGPRGQRGGGRGNPTRGDGDGNLAPRGRGRGGGEPSQYRGRGGRGDGDGDGNLAPRGRGRGGGESSQYRGRGGRGDGRGGRGDRREPKLGDDEYTVTDGTTSTKIFRLVLRSL